MQGSATPWRATLLRPGRCCVPPSGACIRPRGGAGRTTRRAHLARLGAHALRGCRHVIRPGGGVPARRGPGASCARMRGKASCVGVGTTNQERGGWAMRSSLSSTKVRHALNSCSSIELQECAPSDYCAWPALSCSHVHANDGAGLKRVRCGALPRACVEGLARPLPVCSRGRGEQEYSGIRRGCLHGTSAGPTWQPVGCNLHCGAPTPHYTRREAGCC